MSALINPKALIDALTAEAKGTAEAKKKAQPQEKTQRKHGRKCLCWECRLFPNGKGFD